MGRETAMPTKKKSPYQPLPDLPSDEFAALKADVAENGLHYPVTQDEVGNTLDGHQRERALRELGIKRYPTKVVAGLTDEEKWHYALSVNIRRRHMTTKQKRTLIEQELKRTPDIASNWLADILGVDVKIVEATRRRLESTQVGRKGVCQSDIAIFMPSSIARHQYSSRPAASWQSGSSPCPIP
jgi:ParB-like chromosome segregation protein Spo0J